MTLVATTAAISASSQEEREEAPPPPSPLPLPLPLPLLLPCVARSSSAREPQVLIPALLIQTSSPPRASAACAANLLASPGFETSHGAEKIFGDGDDDENFSLTSRSASATLEASLEQKATSSPEVKNPSTRALPMPLDPPVTTTRRGGRLSEARRRAWVEEEEVEEEEEAEEEEAATTPLRLPDASLEHERGAIGAAGALLRVISRTPLLEASAGERARPRGSGVASITDLIDLQKERKKSAFRRPKHLSLQKSSFSFVELLFSFSLSSLFLLLFFSLPPIASSLQGL